MRIISLLITGHEGKQHWLLRRDVLRLFLDPQSKSTILATWQVFENVRGQTQETKIKCLL